MDCIRNIRWIDPTPDARLQSSHMEGKMMKGQKACAVDSRPARHVQVGSVLISMKRHIQRWLELHRQRRLLAQMSDGALKDLGLSRADIQQEVERPFWDDPLKR
ncbi:DUF1127 domain-containing protein [Pseudomonas syringae pv. actinidiae]|uniref:YjiS-like domain-containing protein n=2 Tax=Pseudomonas syringae group TaxID=136849 RepID=A0A261WFK4_9PSED|nr:hypothetical protein B1R35_10315 [Pseudomonas syringae pv. actinidiae]AYL82323.1 DUF1127 domain-containing protein [Pseudomonas syringae pv. actinidiae str. Shaanxi_M228]NAS97693.1 DUF1127 domain-containing protein [Pseudomonas syringae pv. actinidifoliorum]OZI84941.1 hypothetical protein CFN58_21435 [Pseudomonas avellanae]AQX66977.1 hypothetical protein B1F85_25635 [Pseudomonas syringae pv. actinidiae]